MRKFINNSGSVLKVIDEHGEIVFELEEGAQVIRKASIDAFRHNEEELIVWNPGSDYIKVFCKGLENLSGELKVSDINTMTKLAQFLNYETGMLGKAGC